MSLWWVSKDQLDDRQLELIERLSLNESFLVIGPPGSGKTNVLLRRAQFARTQDMPNVLVLTFTRPLVEFLRTGCEDSEGREIFPPNCISTLEAWQRYLYATHDMDLPPPQKTLTEWKRVLAKGALGLKDRNLLPQYAALFVDEAQDLLAEEVELLREWSSVLFFVGDDRQQIFDSTEGLETVRELVGAEHVQGMTFHYRVAPDISRVADRILRPIAGGNLAETGHYKGPLPATVTFHNIAMSKTEQIGRSAEKLKTQLRAYEDMILQGDRLGVIVARKADRDLVHRAFEQDPQLAGKSKVLRAKDDPEEVYDPALDASTPICILTIQGCKGLEFRAVHWLFSDDLQGFHNPQHYYTVVTRAKTSLDVYCTDALPQELTRAHADGEPPKW